MAWPAGSESGRAPNPDRFLQPLELIRSEHGEWRALSKRLYGMAMQPTIDAGQAGTLLENLRRNLSSNALDEEQDLHLLLRRRCKPEDEIEAVLSRLAAERAVVVRLSDDILAELERAPEPAACRVSRSLREKLLTLSRALRRHFALMNSILIPIARARLRSGDLRSLARRIAARRGIILPAGHDR